MKDFAHIIANNIGKDLIIQVGSVFHTIKVLKLECNAYIVGYPSEIKDGEAVIFDDDALPDRIGLKTTIDLCSIDSISEPVVMEQD